MLLVVVLLLFALTVVGGENFLLYMLRIALTSLSVLTGRTMGRGRGKGTGTG